MSPASPALTGGFFTTMPPGKPSMECSNLNEQLLSILVQLLHFGPSSRGKDILEGAKLGNPGPVTCPISSQQSEMLSNIGLAPRS